MAKLSPKAKLTMALLITILIVSASVITLHFSHLFKTQVLNDDKQNPLIAEQSQFSRYFVKQSEQSIGQVADPNYEVSFPRDHYAHSSFDIEWWYLTANLRDTDGNQYNVQWTLFRFRNPNALVGLSALERVGNTSWSNEQFYMAHASVHSDSAHWFSEKFARSNVGNAGIQQSPFALFIDNWRWESSVATADLLPANLRFNTKLITDYTGIHSNADKQINVELQLTRTGPYVLQGQSGYSIKSKEGKHASHYYSAPFIAVEGSIVNSQSQESIAVTGNAWFDQEWTSQLFDQATAGWDWLSLHLDNGDKIMAFRMRLNGQADYITGTYIYANGSSSTLKTGDINLRVIKETKVGNKQLPLHWQLSLPNKNVDLTIVVSKQDQWNPAIIAYYEGAVAVTGSHSGKGFLELTGY